MTNLKCFFKKRNIIILSCIILFIVLVIVLFSIFKDDEDNLIYNSIYSIYPEEVVELYSNMTDVSCHGDLHLDLVLDSAALSVDKMKNDNLLDYVFSYLAKNKQLTDKFDIKIIEDAGDVLLSKKINFDLIINNYQYGNYIYNVNNGIVTRKESKCLSQFYYVTHLYGYSYNEKMLFVDLNICYLKNSVLYDLSNNKLGMYDGDETKLENLFKVNSFYRLNFVIDDGNYK